MDSDSQKLEDQIAEKAKEIHTDGYSMSIGEVLSLYRDGDIDIHPDFQRIFRWNPDQKSRLIESILLKIPIPPIFVSQRASGIWDVIDGVQRLSTIFEFVGVYRNFEGGITEPTTLRGTEYLPELKGFRWEHGDRVFNDALRRDFKRSKIEFRIIRKESDDNAKYDLFQRLNSGTQLSPQEARNCLLVMLNMAMFTELTELSLSEDFDNVISLSDLKEDQAYRQELVLRFFVQKDFRGHASQLSDEYGEYLTTWMRSAAAKYDTPQSVIDADSFLRAFRVLNSSLGPDSFRRYDGQRHLGPFSISFYEFVTSGLAEHLDRWEGRPHALADKVREAWFFDGFRKNSGTGVSPRRRVPRLVFAARDYFSED